MPAPNPKRGEVWLVDFGMAAKVRPALVLSVPFDDADRCLIGVIPHTTALRGSQFEIPVSVPFLDRAGGFLVQGFASVPPRHFIRRLGSLGAVQLVPVENGMRHWLGI
jgi:mRNA interferase MazF